MRILIDCNSKIRFDLHVTLLEIRKLEKPLILIIGRLCVPIVAERHDRRVDTGEDTKHIEHKKSKL